jgi:hypothetical protein
VSRLHGWGRAYVPDSASHAVASNIKNWKNSSSLILDFWTLQRHFQINVLRYNGDVRGSSRYQLWVVSYESLKSTENIAYLVVCEQSLFTQEVRLMYTHQQGLPGILKPKSFMPVLRPSMSIPWYTKHECIVVSVVSSSTYVFSSQILV